jgi:hypothetical protein
MAHLIPHHTSYSQPVILTYLIVCIIQPGGVEDPTPLVLCAAHAALPQLWEQEVALALGHDVPAGWVHNSAGARAVR